MSDWIDDVVKRETEVFEMEDADRERKNSIIMQAAELFVGLMQAVEDAVYRINAPVLERDKLTSLTFSSQSVTSFGVVSGKSDPIVVLIVTNKYDHFAVSRGPIIPDESHKEHKENITIDMDDNRKIFMRTQEGQGLNLQDAVKYLLQPLVS